MTVDSSAAHAAQQHAVYAAKSANDQQKVEGEAAVSLIEAAGSVSSGSSDPAVGKNLDVTA